MKMHNCLHKLKKYRFLLNCFKTTMTHKEPINKRIFENKLYLETTKLVLHAKHPLLRKLVDNELERLYPLKFILQGLYVTRQRFDSHLEEQLWC